MKSFARATFLLALVLALGTGTTLAEQWPARPVEGGNVQRLQYIMVPLIQHMDHPIPLNKVSLKLMDDPQINAANGGGGDFYVTTGLLNQANDDEIRAIMAHEVAHADLGHVAKAQRINTGIGIGVALLNQLWPEASNLAPIAGQLVSNAYSRGEETEADAHAVDLLRRTGYTHASGYDGKQLMADTLSWMAKTQGNTGGFFATHPLTSDRIAAVQRLP
jgi:predicted Zn-dependent protease